MALKKKTNKELNEDVEALTDKVKVLENLVKDLTVKINLKDSFCANKNDKIIEEKIEKIEFRLNEVIKIDEKITKDKSIQCDKCEYSCLKRNEIKQHQKEKHIKVSDVKKCNKCDKTFKENHELENHLKTEHEIENFKCDKCDKTFVLKWRLRKHMSVHETTKYCHYYNNDKFCPYDELGCKFRHEVSIPCKFRECKNILCQFRHNVDKAIKEIVPCELITLSEESTIVVEPDEANQNTTLEDDEKEWKFACQYCTYTNVDEDVFDKHMEEVHKE